MKLKKYDQNLSLLLLGVVMFFGCKKELKPHIGTAPFAQIAFNSVSPQFNSQVQYTSTQQAYIVRDLVDTNIHPPIGSQDIYYPVSSENKFQFPNTPTNAPLAQSAIIYLNLSAGKHLFTLVDTARYLRVRNNINLQSGNPLSVYYADSLGYFKSFILEDKLINEPNNVRLRFLDFSPDAGNVFFTINEKSASAEGFAKSLNYGSVSSFVSYPNPKSDTLRINFYQTTDSTTVIARAFLQADPGRSYSVALQGYYSPFVSYPDPKNASNYISLSGGLSVLINTNN